MKTYPKRCAGCRAVFQATSPATKRCDACRAKAAQPKTAQPKATRQKPSFLERVSAPALPWATPEVCAAVKLGMDTPSAQKTGRFAVVRNSYGGRDEFLLHVPTQKLAFPRENIVLVATLQQSPLSSPLSERRRWKLLPPPAEEATR